MTVTDTFAPQPAPRCDTSSGTYEKPVSTRSFPGLSESWLFRGLPCQSAGELPAVAAGNGAQPGGIFGTAFGATAGAFALGAGAVHRRAARTFGLRSQCHQRR